MLSRSIAFWSLQLRDWPKARTATQISAQTPCEPYTVFKPPTQVGVFTSGCGPQRICTLVAAACAGSGENYHGALHGA